MGKVGLVVGFPSEENLAGLYPSNRISLVVSAGSYWLDSIGIGLWFARRNWILCAGWFANGWMGRMDWMGCWWYGSGVEVPTLASSGTGAPPLSIEGRQAVGSCAWHQLRWCCKGADHLCWSSKIIQIDCTQIVTNM